VSNICPHWFVPELLSDSAIAFPQFKMLFGVLHRLIPLFKKCPASFCGQVVPVGTPVTFSEPWQEREAADRIGRFLGRLLSGIRLAAAIRKALAGLPMVIVAGHQDRQIGICLAKRSRRRLQVPGIEGNGHGMPGQLMDGCREA
jgi:hypothetical protein